jgi:eukaryotic-like serine/threonine-protein kinase
MRYCHECGAIVAPEDTFCSYCGITLEPFPAAQANEAAEQVPAKIASGDLAHDFPFEDAVSNSAAVANQTDLAVEAAIKSAPVPTPAEESFAPPAAAPEENISFDSIYNYKPAPKTDDAPAKDNQPAGDIELETVFGYVPPKEDEPTPEAQFEPQVQVPEPVVEQTPPSFQTSEPIVEPTPVQEAEDNEFSEDMQATLISHSAEMPIKQESQKFAVPQAEEQSELPTVIGGNVSQDIRLEGTEQNPSTEFDLSNVSQDFELQVDDSRGIRNDFAPNNAPQNFGAADSKVPPVLSVSQTDAVPSDREPRQTEANRPQDTPGANGKAQKLKPLKEGTVLNRRYKIVRRIGGGGMGAVYLAEDQNLGGVLRAVKEMIQAYVDENQQEKAVQDFRRESVLLTQLDHPAIPTIYDYFFDEVNGRFYLVMKYISGGDLAARLRAAPEGKLDEGSITEWAIQIADVLDYLHRRDPPIVYRDLKPSNIMLDGTNNKAMLIDFGIARWVNKEEKGVTAVGTMGYAPPELFAGNADARSDIYSLGATMFHLLTGADPQSNPLLIFDFTKNPRPRQINMMISVEMEDILLRAVEYNAGLRFETAAKMRDALREHLDKLRAGRLTFERKQNNPVQAMPIPAQTPPPVPFAQQPQVNLVFCGFCGEKIIATDLFCAYCGAPQQNAPPANQMEQTMMPGAGNAQYPAQSGAATARLVVLGTSELDAPLFPLEKDTILVGREDRSANIFPEVDLTRYDTKAQVSRRHARIWRDGGGSFMIEDLRSSNGTILIGDDNKIVRLQANQPHLLQHGDRLKLGETTLRFYVN